MRKGSLVVGSLCELLAFSASFSPLFFFILLKLFCSASVASEEAVFRKNVHYLPSNKCQTGEEVRDLLQVLINHKSQIWLSPKPKW